jgi:hypothetical protein
VNHENDHSVVDGYLAKSLRVCYEGGNSCFVCFLFWLYPACTSGSKVVRGRGPEDRWLVGRVAKRHPNSKRENVKT